MLPIELNPGEIGPLAQRLRHEAGLTVREVGEAVGVSHVSVVKAEGGSSALAAVALRAAGYLLERLTGARVDPPLEESSLEGVPVVRESDGAADRPAALYLGRLLEVERGWRRALVRGVMEEHGLEVETEGATATIRAGSGGDELVLRFDLDRGTVETDGKLLKLIETGPYERAGREGWGEALEQLAAVYAPKPNRGWVKHEEGDESAIMSWLIDEDAEYDVDGIRST